MLSLGRNSRIALAGAASISFAAALGTLPSAARGAAGATPAARASAPLRPAVVRTVSAPVTGRIAPRRDPFAGGTAPAAVSATGQQSQNGVVAMQQPLPPIPTPPPAAPPAVAHVTAIVTGRHPSALLDEAGTTRIVTDGDVVDGERVSSIRIDGVHLANGTTLPVTPYLAPPNGGR